MAYCRWSEGCWYAFPCNNGDDENEDRLALWHVSKGHASLPVDECVVLVRGGVLLDSFFHEPLTKEERQEGMEVVCEFLDEYPPVSSP
jgi:hypothetical protein